MGKVLVAKRLESRKVAKGRVSKAKRPKLKLITNSKPVHAAKPVKGDICIREVGKNALTVSQQEALIGKYRLKARKLGRSILRRWHARIELEELDSVVDLSLCEAVRRFDPNKGASFMTFLFYHLKGNLVKAVASSAASAAIPNAIAELSDSAFADGEQRHYSSGTLNAIELAEAVSSQGIPQPDEALWRKELSAKSTDACEKLDDLEREIVKRIFVQEQQIIDIAAALGYSRCHISRIKKKALSVLHEELKVVMNRDDYRASAQSELDDEEGDDVVEKVGRRKAIHRRRPRSGAIAKKPLDRAAAEAA